MATDALARALYGRLFAHRGVDLSRVALDRRSSERRELWLGAEGAGLHVVKELAMQQTRDDEIEVERDLIHEAGLPGEPRWFRLSSRYQALHVEIGVDDAALLSSLRDLVFRVGKGESEVACVALGALLRLTGMAQNAFGTMPASLQGARFPFTVLDGGPDRDAEALVAQLDVAAAEGSRRAAIGAAVVRARNGAAAEALTRLDAVLAEQPDESDAASMRILVLVRAGRSDDARARLEQTAARDERDHMAHAIARIDLGDLRALHAALGRGPLGPSLDVQAPVARAVIAERLGDHAGAIEAARAHLAKSPAIARTFASVPPHAEAQPLLFRLRGFETWRALFAEAGGTPR